MADKKPKIKDIPLNGKVITSQDAATIGANFQQLTNMRYTDSHPKGVAGMVEINSTALTNAKIRSGFHYRKEQPAESHVLVQALNSAETSSSIYDNTAIVPTTTITSEFTLGGDNSDRVALTNATKVTVTGLDKDEEAWVVVDKTAGYFSGDLEFHVQVNCTSNAGASDTCGVWALANTVDTLKDIDTASGDYLGLYWYELSSDNYLGLYECNGGSLTGDGSISLSTATEYYLKIKRDESVGTYGTLYCYIYTGSIGGTLVDTLTVTLTEKQDFQYLYWMVAVESGGTGAAWNGTIQNLGGANFEDSTILDQETGFGTARFSTAPNNNMVMCDKKGAYIWGGNEKPCSAFITSTAAVTNSITNPIDYTQEVTNTLTTASEVAIIGGGNDSYTKLLLHFDEADAGTDFDDSSTSAHATTANGTAQVDTAQSKFGVGSGLLDGNSDYISIGDHADFFMSTGTFTVDFWVRFTSQVDQSQALFGQYEDANNFVQMAYGSYYLSFAIAASPGTNLSGFSAYWNPDANRWYHVAVIRGWGGNANDFAITIDGTELVTKTSDAAWGDFTGDFLIGYTESTTVHLDGWLDEFRVSKGIARWTANFTPPTRAYSTAALTWLVGATRPLKGVKFYIGDANTTASTMTTKEWNGASWTTLTSAVNTWVDNTDTGASLAATGTVTWDTTESSSKIKYLNGLALYWYQFAIDAGSATIYYCTVDAAMQTVKDIWDGVERSITSFQVYDAAKVSYADQTINVYSDNYDSANTGTYAKIISLATSATEWFIVGFPERMMGVNFAIVPDKGNDTAATTVTVSFWNGSAWSQLSGVSDGTSSNSISIAQSGVTSWQPPEKGEEFAQEVGNNPPFYYYKFGFDTVSAADVQIYYITGIPAQKSINAYSFPVHAGNSLWLCSEQDGDKNKMIRSLPGTSVVFNGDGYSEYYIGDESELMAGAVIYSQLGSNLYEVLVVCKKSETHILVPTYTGIETFLVAKHIGCVAPGTMRSLNIGDLASGNRNVCIWQGAEGLYLFDGKSPVRISDDIQNIFDKSNTTTGINRSYIHASYGFFDIENYEYHWCFASGTATVPDDEWVFDIKRKRWYQFDRGAGNDLMAGIEVESTLGVPYSYGLDNSGQMYRLEYGTDFDGVDITQTFHLGDAPLEETIMRETRIRKINLVCKATNTTTNTITATLYKDGATTAGSTHTLTPQASGKTIAQTSEGVDSQGVFHSVKMVMITDDETVGFEPMYLGALYKHVRMV